MNFRQHTYFDKCELGFRKLFRDRHFFSYTGQ